ncbi:MAG: hypothetical protein AAGD00_00605 [Planctomycetota bacterium]
MNNPADKPVDHGAEGEGPPKGVADRRLGFDRRNNPFRPDEASGLERRRGPGRRRSDFLKSAEEGEMNPEQFTFLLAIDTFKRANQKTFPTWTDVLEIVRLLGYRKVQESQLNLSNVDDWTERPDAPADVRIVKGDADDDDEG